MRTPLILLLLLVFFPGAVLAQDPTASAVATVDVKYTSGNDGARVTVDSVPQALIMEPGDDTGPLPISISKSPASIKIIVYEIQANGKVGSKSTASCKVQTGLTTAVTITENPVTNNGSRSWTIVCAAPR